MKKFILSVFTLAFVLNPVNLVMAEEVTISDPVAITSGITGDTGTQLKTGPRGATGPIGATGVVGTTGPVIGDNTSANSVTGADSVNENDVSVDNETVISLTEDASIDNEADLTLNTGNNTVGANTSAEDLIAGEIDSSINIVNLSNTVLSPDSTASTQTLDGNQLDDLTITGAGGTNTVSLPTFTPADLSNYLTRKDSSNYNTVDINNILSFLYDLKAENNNNIAIDANTGGNNIENNTKIGDIITGDINLCLSLINLQNFINPDLILSLGISSILNGLSGDIILPDLANAVTGAYSDNQNQVINNSDTDIHVSANTTQTNNLDVNSNTGNNEVGRNTVVGDVKTGDQNIVTNVLSAISSPVFYIINVFGKWLGQSFGLPEGSFIVNEINDEALLENNITGASSDNQNIVENNRDVELDLNANSEILNNLKINANTGGNKISNNTLTGNIKTGSVNILTNLINLSNIFGGISGKVKLGIINIFGDWNGNLCKNVCKKKEEVIPPPPVKPEEEVIPPAEKPEAPKVVQEVKKVQRAVAAAAEIIPPVQQPEAAPLSGTTFPYLYLLVPAAIMSLWILAEVIAYRRRMMVK